MSSEESRDSIRSQTAIRRVNLWQKNEPTVDELIGRAYWRFAQAHPRWVASLFDEHFLRTHAAPVLRQYLGGGAIAPVELARAWVAQLSWPSSSHRVDLGAITAVATEFLGYLDEELSVGGGHTAGEVSAVPPADPAELGHVLAVYALVLSEGSNYALDWLWLAAKLPLPADRRFCLERALEIDPGCALARHGLAQLASEERPGNRLHATHHETHQIRKGA